MNENVKQLIENDELMEGLATCKTPEELAKLLEANSLVLEDGLSIEEAFALVKKQADDELDVTDLDSVSGGIGFLVGAAAAGMLIVSAGCICFLAGYAYQKYSEYRRSRR